MKLTLLLLAAAGLVTGLYFAFRPSSEPPTLAPATAPPDVRPGSTEKSVTIEVTHDLRITVRDAEPVGGIQHFTVTQGEKVSVRVVSDVADEVHVHGYDITGEVRPGGTSEIEFQATIAGRFEIELEERGIPIAELEVRP